MIAFVLAGFLAAVPIVAAAQPAATPPTIEQAVAKAHMLFCMPLVGKEATNTGEIAQRAGYRPTPLPNFGGLKVRSASAWLVPSTSGRVVVSRGAADERNAQGSREQSGIRMEKFDWKMPDKKALLSVMTVTLPDNSPSANFFVHTHMVR